MKHVTIFAVTLFAATPWALNADCAAPSAASITGRAVAPTKEAPQAIKHITTLAQFKTEVTDSELPVVVKFFATWCPPCTKIGPEFEKLSKLPELAGKVKFLIVDVDKGSAISSKEGVMSMPTLIFYKKGQIAQRSMGYKTANQLRQLITSHFGI